MIGRFRSPAKVQSTEPKSFDDFELRLGDLMRGERATLGKSLLDVQRELKIKANYIAAIENSDPTAFDTPGFIAGYVRSYARYLDLDPEWAFGVFCTESGFETSHGMSSDASSLRTVQKTTRRRKPQDPLADPNASFVPRGEAVFSGVAPGALGSVAVLGLLIAAIGYGGWTILKEVQQVDFSPNNATLAGLGVETIGEIGADPLNARAGARLADAEASGGEDLAFDRLYRPEALDIPVLVARDGPIATLDPNQTGAFAPGVARDRTTAEVPGLIAAGQDSPIQVTEASAPELRLVAVRPAWVRVSAASGTVLFEKVLDAGEEYTLPMTDTPPELRVGDSGAIYFAVNGAHFGPAGESGTVTAGITLSSDAISETYALADPEADQDLARMVAQAPSR